MPSIWSARGGGYWRSSRSSWGRWGETVSGRPLFVVSVRAQIAWGIIVSGDQCLWISLVTFVHRLMSLSVAICACGFHWLPLSTDWYHCQWQSVLVDFIGYLCPQIDVIVSGDECLWISLVTFVHRLMSQHWTCVYVFVLLLCSVKQTTCNYPQS